MRLSERNTFILDEIWNNCGHYVQFYEGTGPQNCAIVSFWVRLSEQKQTLEETFFINFNCHFLYKVTRKFILSDFSISVSGHEMTKKHISTVLL